MKTARLHVPRLLCPLCMKNVSRSVSELPGVQHVDGGFWKNRVLTVSYDESACDTSRLANAANGADFRLSFRRFLESLCRRKFGNPRIAHILK